MTQQNKLNPTYNKIHSNKYKMTIPKVPILAPLFEKYSLNFLELAFKGTAVPAFDISPIKVHSLASKPVKVIGAGSDLPDIKVKLLLDNKMETYYILWNWLNITYQIQTGEGVCLEDNPSPFTDITIAMLDNFNNTVAKFTYRGAFIIGLGEIAVDYENTDRIEIDATFTYDDFSMELVT